MTDTSPHPPRGRSLAARCAALALLVLAAAVPGGVVLTVAPGGAWADDDDDDGGGRRFRRDDDDDDGGGGWRLRLPVEPQRLLPRRAQPRRAQTRRAQTPRRTALPPQQVADEIVALGLSESEIAELVGRGYAVLQQHVIGAAAQTLVRLDVPQGTTLAAAREEVRLLNALAVADFNHYYRPEQRREEAADRCEGAWCVAPRQVAWPASAHAERCGGGARVGMVDTGINAAHDTFAGQDLVVLPLADKSPSGGGADSDAKHGTAVAALLIGAPDSRSPGLLGGARLYAVDPFLGRADVRADVYALVRAIDALLEADVSVINLSLAGPDNALLERVVADIGRTSVIVVASTGNDGPRAEPRYPAAYPSVVAVTAVDRGGRVYRRAGRGAHVDFAAPGVEVWTAASVRGARPKTGTSFATPFVTAAVVLAQRGLGLEGQAAVRDALAARAADLGAQGRDDIYGFGLVQGASLCGSGGEIKG